jgi:hypothetical protein
MLAKTGVRVKGRVARHQNTWAWLFPERGRDERLCGLGGQLDLGTLYSQESNPAHAQQSTNREH